MHMLPLCTCLCVSYVLSLVCFISLYCKIDVAHCGATCLGDTLASLCVCWCVCVCPVIVTLGRESDTGGRSPLSDLESRPIHQLFLLSILSFPLCCLFSVLYRAITAITALKATARASVCSSECVCVRASVCVRL